MIEAAAILLLLLWVAGLVLGFSGGGVIHLLLVGAVALLLIHRHSKNSEKARSQVSPAGILAININRSRAEPE